MTTRLMLPDLGEQAVAKPRCDPMMTYREWERLLHKAWADGIVLVPHPSNDGLSLCLSQTRLRHNEWVEYAVGLYGCSCPARRPCKHRALWLFEHPDDLSVAVLPAPHEDAASDREAISA